MYFGYCPPPQAMPDEGAGVEGTSGEFGSSLSKVRWGGNGAAQGAPDQREVGVVGGSDR